jgi:hypothetical protein
MKVSILGEKCQDDNSTCDERWFKDVSKVGEPPYHRGCDCFVREIEVVDNSVVRGK